MLVSIAFYGCAGKQAASIDYKQMAALQQQKSQAKKAEEPPLPPGLAATAETHEQLGDASLRQGNAIAAFTEYERSLRKDPQRMTARYKIGMLYLGRGLSEEALKEFEQILAKEPQNASAHYGRAKVRFLQGKPELAKGDLRDALKLDERLWQAHTLLGVVCDTEGHHAEAEEAYLRALAIQPDSATVYNDLGYPVISRAGSVRRRRPSSRRSTSILRTAASATISASPSTGSGIPKTPSLHLRGPAARRPPTTTSATCR